MLYLLPVTGAVATPMLLPIPLAVAWITPAVLALRETRTLTIAIRAKSPTIPIRVCIKPVSGMLVSLERRQESQILVDGIRGHRAKQDQDNDHDKAAHQISLRKS